MKLAAYLLFAVVAAVGVTWTVQGRSLITETKRLVSETVVDEFGDRTEKTRWEPGLRIGLLDVLLPTGGVAGGGALALLWLARRARRRAQRASGPSAPNAPNAPNATAATPARR